MIRTMLLLALILPGFAAAAPLKTKHVVLIVSDGLRWQEMFKGAEQDLLTTDHGGNWYDDNYLKSHYWRDTEEARRAALFPFIWGTIAKQGQIIGNQDKGSIARVTNGLAFSYPGYNEMLTGTPDPRIDSNEYGPNPNVTVFEWLNNKPAYHNQVAVFASWGAFSDIFNQKRAHLATLVAGSAPPYPDAQATPAQAMVNRLYRETTALDLGSAYDAFFQVPLVDFARTGQARAMFVGYGETDDWGHAGRYDLLLESAHGFDHHVEELWNTLQARPEYRGTTTFILTADHGRGSGPEDWKEHGVDQKGSENIWIAAIGPDTPPLGERSHIPDVTQAQLAATVAALLGEDYNATNPKAAPPIAELLPH